VGNTLHHADVGGIDEGSFCINAVNVFQEPPRFFLKIADRGRVCREVETTITRNSRLPDTVALDLRAQVGAINVSRQRLKEIVKERGVETVLGVINRSIDYAEERLRELLSEVPDGSWSAEVYMDGDRVGSERIHRIRVKLDKRGTELYFDYTGTDPQAMGPVNATWAASYAGMIAPIYDFIYRGTIDWNSSIKRCVHMIAPEGTLANAQYPAAVSICSIGMCWLTMVAATKVVAMMLSASGTHRDLVCSSWGASCNAVNIFGVNSAGKRVGAMLSDHRGGGAAGRSFADGFDQSGMTTSYLTFMGNVESQEWKLPILYLFRQQLTDSGGAGKYRGGLSVIVGVAPYKVERLIFKGANTAGTDQSNASGIDGGYPGAGSQVILLHGVDSREWIAQGRDILQHLKSGIGVNYLPCKSEGVMNSHDLLVFHPPGGGGYGDPLDRDANRVREDLRNRAISREWCRSHYGVVVDDAGEVDQSATQRERQSIIDERLRQAQRIDEVQKKHGGAVARKVGEYFDLVQVGEDRVIRCNRCEYVYCPEGEDPKNNAAVRIQALGKAGPRVCARYNGDSPNFELVERTCPGCGVMVDVEERLKGSGPVGTTTEARC
jgi:N-methylhydantoinase B